MEWPITRHILLLTNTATGGKRFFFHGGAETCTVLQYGARGNSSKTFSGRFCANRGNQPIKLLGLAEILLFKVKLIIYVLELIPWLRSMEAKR